MFGEFFKRKKISVPEFQALEASLLKDKYFIRVKPWDWLNKKEIYVASKLNDRPTMITMDFWPQEIYLSADGQITVSEFIHIAAKKFIDNNHPAPEHLDAELIEQLEALVNEMKIVELKVARTDLNPIVVLPMSKQLNAGA
ncbi:hypothetical protein [Pedobacter cryoconitis]|uniref:Uncharacterized protein n=1 Tax=Pedobacter cryoconitis TaxID=188932 RepID=A0A7X0IZM1_9SPHI|nr:hypothetical protein [Pedobacter cryoconitis]MBB6498313.1 hypothetical protein [Pedobacter cryoconitis]